MISFFKPRSLKASNDSSSLQTLLVSDAKTIANVCRAIVGSQDAQDATQEAFEKIVRHFASFDAGKGTFTTWACSVARNTCRDRLRRRGIEIRTFELSAPDDHGAQESGTPERIAQRNELAAHLDRAMQELPETHRTALVLFHLHDMSYEEIARVLDVPIGTVMTWLHRSRARLRSTWEAT